ncbi:MAG: outer membrane lipoprotein carrier protein LolA [Sphingobacteriales bacterium]|nr:MAG: outer membrane lipoprotein carrier protein LolA [Sphingobacteriales bacterium]
MKRFLLMSALAFCSLAQPVMAQTDAKAKTILQNVTKKINGLKSVKANFALHLLSANGKTKQTKKGTFYMKGPKYRVTLADQEIICDNKTVWTFVKGANEVQVNNFNPNEQTISPAKLFTNFYDKEYRSRYVGTRTVSGKACDILELIPVGNGKQFSKVELAVDKSGTIVGGNVFEKNGNQYRYEVSGFAANAAVSDALFTFDKKKYPGVEVVDLR